MRRHLGPPPLAQGGAQDVLVVLGRMGSPHRARGLRATTCPRGVAQRGVDRLALQEMRGGLVEDAESWCNVGLEREALQQALAERVDGLHLEAARRFDGGGEKRARKSDILAPRRAVIQVG
jgi:hypothetical protein